MAALHVAEDVTANSNRTHVAISAGGQPSVMRREAARLHTFSRNFVGIICGKRQSTSTQAPKHEHKEGMTEHRKTLERALHRLAESCYHPETLNPKP